jgi:LmbE family N-acetylglucosaminyl deacetylase
VEEEVKVLVISAHPDDSEIGCGGAIIRHVNNGAEVEVLLMTDGELGCPGMDPLDVAKVRIHEAFEACIETGAKIAAYWSYPDGSLPVNEETVTRLGLLLKEKRPNIIFSPYDYDAHADHRAATQILKAVLENTAIWPEVYLYEVWTPLPEYDFKLDITDEIGKKIKAIRKHESQVSRVRFDEAALSLARYRGELHNRPLGPFAEVYKRLYK